MIDSVKGVINKWFISQLDSERALNREVLYKKLNQHCPDCIVESYLSISKAYLAAKQQANTSSRIVVFGSFLTVAEVLGLEV